MHSHFKCSHYILFYPSLPPHCLPSFLLSDWPVRTTLWSQDSSADQESGLKFYIDEKKISFCIPPEVHWLEPQVGEIRWAQHVTDWLHLVFSKWPQGPDAIRHTELSASVSGLASLPLAQQQMTRWEANMTSERSRKVRATVGGVLIFLKKIQTEMWVTELPVDSCLLWDCCTYIMW